MCYRAVAKANSLLIGPESQELLVPQGLQRCLVERDDGLVVRCRDGYLRVVDHFGEDVQKSEAGLCNFILISKIVLVLVILQHSSIVCRREGKHLFIFR